jgi:hypothetical protein
MSEEQDRIAKVSDLRSLGAGIRRDMWDLEGRLIATIETTAEETRRHFDMVVLEAMRQAPEQASGDSA